MLFVIPGRPGFPGILSPNPKFPKMKNMPKNGLPNHRLHPSVATWRFTLSTCHFLVAIYGGTLCADMMS